MKERYFKFDVAEGFPTILFKYYNHKWYQYTGTAEWRFMHGYFVLPEDNVTKSQLIEINEQEVKKFIFINSL